MKREPQNDLRYIKTENLIQETFRSMLGEMDNHPGADETGNDQQKNLLSPLQLPG